MVTANGEIYENLKTKNTEVTNVKQLMVSSDARYILTKEGDVWAKGNQYVGGWGDGNRRDSYVKITADGTNPLPKISKMYISNETGCIVYLTEDNQVYWMGLDTFSKLPGAVGDLVVASGSRRVTL